MSALKPKSIASDEALPTGCLVMYENNGTPLIGAIASLKKNKFVVLNERGREVEMPPQRLHRLPGKITESGSSATEKLLALRSDIDAKKNNVDLEEIWSLTREETTLFDTSSLTTIYFGSDTLLDHATLRISLLEDKIFFKRNGDKFEARAENSVEELKRASAVEEERRRAEGAAVEFVRNRMSDKELSIPVEIEDLFADIEYYAADAAGLNPARLKEIRRFLERIESELKISLGKFPAYKLLSELGFITAKTNLIPTRHRANYEFTEELLVISKQIEATLTEDISSLSNTEIRRDLRKLRTFTIDDKSTLDMDDALSLTFDGSKYSLYVHISDVASLITYDSPLDQEARHRATSIYLPDQTITMFPAALSNNCLSLVVGEERPAMTFYFELNDSFELLNRDIFLSTIIVDQRLDYDSIDKELFDGAPFEIEALGQIASTLEAGRIERGALRVAKRDTAIEINLDGYVTLQEFDEHTPARLLVGEMMILANESAAIFAAEHGICVPFRSQDAPDQTKAGMEAPEGPARDFQKRIGLKRSGVETSPRTHAGLGLKAYTQVTSPIRRYADLIVQRQIKEFLIESTQLFNIDTIKEILVELGDPLGRANTVTKESKRYWLLRYLEQKKASNSNATITGTLVRSDGKIPLVELDEIFITVPLRFSKIPALGTQLTLRILGVEAINDYIRLEEVSP